jgi:hypothetical protein
MSLFTRKYELKVADHIKSSFDKVKDDMGYIMNWLKFFHQRQEAYEIRLKLIESQIEYMPKSPADIKRAIDQYYSYDTLHSRVRQLHEKVDTILDTHKPIMRRLEDVEDSLSRPSHHNEAMLAKIKELHNKLEMLENRAIPEPKVPKNLMRESIVEKVAKNSKTYVKNVILSLIQKYGRVSGLQLKEIVVDEQGLCSRSSFYRLLGELESEHPLNMTWSGKEKQYLSEISPKLENRF